MCIPSLETMGFALDYSNGAILLWCFSRKEKSWNIKSYYNVSENEASIKGNNLIHRNSTITGMKDVNIVQ